MSQNTSFKFSRLVAQISPHTETCIPSHTCHWQILQHVCNHHMPTKREASCLRQQTVSASDTHTSCRPKWAPVSSPPHYKKPLLQAFISTRTESCTSETTSARPPGVGAPNLWPRVAHSRQNYLHVCAVACEPERDAVMKILSTAHGVSNYKQAYFSIQLKLTDWQEQLSSPSLWRHYTLIKRVLFLCESRTESVIIPFLSGARSDRTSTGGFMRWRELVLSLYLFIRHLHTDTLASGVKGPGVPCSSGTWRRPAVPADARWDTETDRKAAEHAERQAFKQAGRQFFYSTGVLTGFLKLLSLTTAAVLYFSLPPPRALSRYLLPPFVLSRSSTSLPNAFTPPLLRLHFLPSQSIYSPFFSFSLSLSKD